jgi:hypothetical protein
MYKTLYANKTQRKAIVGLLSSPEIKGLAGLLEVIAVLPHLCSQPYAPKVITPYELLRDWSRIKSYISQQQALQSNGGAGVCGNYKEFLESN